MPKSEQEAKRSHGVVQVTGSVHGNVVVMADRVAPRSRNNHFAVQKKDTAEVMRTIRLLEESEYKNVMGFMERQFTTQRIVDITDEERFRVLRYAQALIKVRAAPPAIAKAPVINNPVATEKPQIIEQPPPIEKPVAVEIPPNIEPQPVIQVASAVNSQFAKEKPTLERLVAWATLALLSIITIIFGAVLLRIYR